MGNGLLLLAQKMGIIAVLFTLAGLTSLGLPGLSGFAAELLIFIGIFQSYEIWGIILGSLAVIGAAITAVYILRLLAKVFFGLADETLPEYLDSTPREKFAASILVIFIVLVGLWPFPFVKIIESGVEPILLQIVGAG